MSKKFWGILLAIAVIFVAVVLINNHNKQNATNKSDGAKPTHHVEGKGQSGVTLVEYGDYQCPVCGSFFPVTQQVEQKYKDQVYFQFRNLPLPSLHPNAFAAARAAEAAGLQGKYFEMHDQLYENQNSWASASNPLPYFDSYARSIGLNISKFNKDMNSSIVNNKINADIAAFDKTGDEKATPTYYLNGKKIDNAKLIDQSGPSLEAFSKVIDAAIAKADKQHSSQQ